MSADFKLIENRVEVDLYQEIETLIRKDHWRWQSVSAMTGLVGGCIAPILGAASDITAWLVISANVISFLHVLSIVLCALTIPLLVLGASCLDLLEGKSAKLRPATAQGFARTSHPSTSGQYV